MPVKLHPSARGAYDYPLLIKNLLSGLPQWRDQWIVSDDRRYTYGTFETRIARLASALSRLGVEPGQTVAVMDWDSHRYLECYFAVPSMGAVLQTVNVRLSPQQIAFTLAQTGAETLIYHQDFAPLVAQIAGSLPALQRRIVMAPATAEGCVDNFEAMVDSGSPDFVFPDFDENAVATTFHTTGTTGDPKAVSFSHRQLVLHTLAVGTALANQPDGQGFRRGDVYMPMTPMFHVHAWGMPYLAVMVGVKQVYPGRYEPKRLLALKRSEGVTFSHCVSTILRMLLDALGEEEGGLAPWTMVIGGGPLPTSLMVQAREKGISTIGGYGMSETGPVIALARVSPDDPPEARCRAGLPAPLVHVRVDVPAGGGEGELLLRAPWLTNDYPGTPAAGEALWEGGWLHTQDIARIAPDGGVSIVDRMKDVIKTGGEWVSATLLEELTLRHPAVEDVAFIGVPHPRWGERPLAVLATKGRIAPPSLEGLQAHLRAYADAGAISRYAVPDEMMVIEALPRTSVGKVDKKNLRILAEHRPEIRKQG
ncbi:long-chain-fatty-acid--CoA ligase [Niveispirillum sp.]|uniref:long-chain-fatty-acid--CoA ligase n=1 Tax=Niveispirillum sp. TaxID=1917217 RepID=UPI001B5F9B11|nr:long-chain-fatty-acid--CoA ligase [Niveispirillum sp.]MBP7334240.1 long-chain-fatty-acid--CoA ligase [Niveispirillum sp.]